MKKYILFFIPLCLLACHKQTFTISGTLDHAGETLYFEQMAVDNLTVLDSIVLPKSGKFSFKQVRPAYSELYRLRLNTQSIILAIDSTECIEITGTIREPEIVNSPKSIQIRELRESLRTNTLDEHKTFARDIILSDPRSIVAYYALLQVKGQEFVFDVFNKQDRICYQAVATSFNTFMPESKRSKALYKAVLEVIEQERAAKQQLALQQFIDSQENAFLDIELPDENGKTQSLSQYKGKVILLDFSAVGMEQSTAYIFELRNLYQKYHTQGLEIYQVSADQDKDFWQQSAQNLPWTTVHAEYSDCFRQYNVQTLPTMFLFNRKGEVIARFTNFSDIAKEIEKCLK